MNNEPDPPDTQPVSFISRIHVKPAGFLTRVPANEEDYLVLARDLLLLYQEIRREISRVPAERASTREEVYRRLSAAREFMHANIAAPLLLADIARAACLSPYHFHRSFTAAFGVTPHAYLTRLRLDRAAGLLAKGELTVGAVAEAAGFESAASFSLLFRRTFGVSPSHVKFSKIR